MDVKKIAPRPIDALVNLRYQSFGKLKVSVFAGGFCTMVIISLYKGIYINYLTVYCKNRQLTCSKIYV